MWSYYGAKTNIVRLYPKPKNPKIIEGFAGSARYALYYFENEVLLVDQYEVVFRIWKWLQQCSPTDILKLPRLKYNQTFDEFKFDCDEAKWLCSFVHGSGNSTPKNKPTRRKTIDRPNHANYNLKRISQNLYKIKHWEIIQGSYKDIPNQKATWFIDPPYQYGGEAYSCSNKKINFSELRDWSQSREGQVIVCENTKAHWMDFVPMTTIRGSLKKSTEAIWTNEKTLYNNIQQTLSL